MSRKLPEPGQFRMEIFPGFVWDQDSACAEAIGWLEMEELVFRVDGEIGNAGAAKSTIALIKKMQSDIALLRANK